MLTWRMGSAKTAKNDGMNCPEGFDENFWEKADIQPFDCDTNNGIVSIYHDETAASYYKVAQLDFTLGPEGQYNPLYQIDYSPYGVAHDGEDFNRINSVALYHHTATDKFYASGAARTSKLALFRRRVLDARRGEIQRCCFAGALSTTRPRRETPRRRFVRASRAGSARSRAAKATPTTTEPRRSRSSARPAPCGTQPGGEGGRFGESRTRRSKSGNVRRRGVEEAPQVRRLAKYLLHTSQELDQHWRHRGDHLPLRRLTIRHHQR